MLKSKNIHENKSANQIDLFGDKEKENDAFIEINEDWTTETKLNKEFETLGFYISDHPLKQFKPIYKKYNIINFEEFENITEILSANIACTVLKVQEKKTQKGTSYAIVKFSDLNNTFELFIFSDVFEINRNILIEGNSLMLTLIKNYSDENKTQKRINVKKIVSLNEVIDSPINNIALKFDDINEIQKLCNLSNIDAQTDINFTLKKDDQIISFRLKNKRKVDNKLINSLNLEKNIVIN